jgi:diguanylate cyclase (GGDEF)-like protein
VIAAQIVASVVVTLAHRVQMLEIDFAAAMRKFEPHVPTPLPYLGKAMIWVLALYCLRQYNLPGHVWILIYALLALFVLLTVRQLLAINDNKRWADRYHDASVTDPLTGLGNQAKLSEVQENLGENDGRMVTILMIDLDDFKEMNTRYGHEGGDVILSIVGERIRACVRADEVAVRSGGDEFVVILPDEDETAGRSVADRLLRMFHDPLVIEVAGIEHVVEVRASIGIATGECAMFGDVTRRADMTMMHIKTEEAKDHFETAVDQIPATALEGVSE